jgi:hypothetical protein
VSTSYTLPPAILEQTFAHLRTCGGGRRECQVLWTSSWDAPHRISQVVHPRHQSHGGGFVLDSAWLDEFWIALATANRGIRVQVHTHPLEAFHSPTDDEFPIIHKPGFLSLVIPTFALGPASFENAYLTEIQSDGRWQQVSIAARLGIA